MKLKSLWCSVFQVQNSYMISKSMKRLDAPLTNNNNEDGVPAPDTLADYRIRREKNNESVRKSRAKNRVKLQECATHVQELRKENTTLNKQLDGLQSELATLKGLFQHCFSFNLNSLAIEPSEIPTSALCKIIMQRKEQPDAPMTPASSDAETSPVATPATTSIGGGGGFTLADHSASNKTDQFYIDQIKTALTSIVRQDLSTVGNMRDHDYSVRPSQ
jgi:hypothetical protein